jgi:hypothetical protein
MKFFTPEEIEPSEKTLNIIRQIARTYRVVHVNGKEISYCIN